ncbi:copper-transporting ATPase ran1-like protein [Trifolium pratense]|uniref:Copper-transporting ATPase ran1-like protein n=1 Tax=Trifolium pratense TaxID=57577 RepID=A0A2K3PQZ9_TRIPR|nr:copper-transporting ATPase ran1-like protein [Trifolium pratense]
MAPGVRNLQLTTQSARRKVASTDDMENVRVRLLDSDDDDEMRRIQIRVSGMTCTACSNSIESALKAIDGVVTASVALLQNKADVVFNPALVKDEDIKNAIEDAGFEADILPESSGQGKIPHETLVGQFTIGGMTCAACVNSVEGILRDLPGVKRAVVALATSLGEVEYDPSVISKDDIVNAIEDSGFEASFVQSNEQDKIIYGVVGVYSVTDAQVLEGMLSNMKGVRQFRFDQISGELDVLFDPQVLSPRSLVDGIHGESNGKFKLRVRSPYTRMVSKDVEETSTIFRLFISSLCLSVPLFFMKVVCPHIPFMYSLLLWRCGPFLMGDWVKWALVSVIQFGIGKRFYIAAGRALRNGSTNMDVLIAVGTTASYVYSVYALLYGALTGFWSPTYFETSAMLITFVLLGKYLEVLAKGKTSDAIKKLVELAPATAILITNDKDFVNSLTTITDKYVDFLDGKSIEEREIDSLLVQPGDTLKVLPGTKIPADGIVTWGSSYVNESMVTGESVPVLKEVNVSVIGAQMSKAPIQKFADYVASIFVPTVISLALLTFLSWYIAGSIGAYPDEWLPENGTHFVFALMFSISVVVIACPCALGLATPTAVMVATGVGANNGVLIKGGDALERAQMVKYVIFDKTGTLTQGKASVTTAKVFTEMQRGEFLTLVASAESLGCGVVIDDLYQIFSIFPPFLLSQTA